MNRHRLPRILHGEDEAIFDVLPDSVLANFGSSASENAVLWNVVYQLAQPTISFRDLLALPYLWGTASRGEDDLAPYYWGFDVRGVRLTRLDDELLTMDGPGPKTEVDLFLVGAQNLILLEVKNQSAPGQCSRWLGNRCPEVHAPGGPECLYWDRSPGFQDLLTFSKPALGDDVKGLPPCARHYQLARTLLLAHRMGQRLDLQPSVWMVVPRRRWRSLARSWRAFADGVTDSDLWRRLRVLSWEALQSLHAPEPTA